MNKPVLAIIACFGMLGSAAAVEQSGAYVGFGGGLAYSNASRIFAYTTTTTNETTNAGFKAYGGYSWGRWGVEAGYYDLAKYSVAGTIFGVSSSDEIALSTIGLSATRAFPIGKQWSLMTKFGLGLATTKYHCIQLCTGISDANTDTVVPLLGFGAKWNIQQNLALRADWEGIGGATVKVGATERYINGGLFSVGIQAQF